MVLETLRYADEVNKAQNYFREIPDDQPDPELLDLASALIDRKTAAFDPQEFHDRYVDALKELVERKRRAHGEKIIEDKDSGGRTGNNVVDLMAALKKSMEKSGATPANDDKPVAAKKAPARKPAAKKPPAAKEEPAPAPAKKPAARKRA